MICPDCNHIQTCPCEACQKRNPTPVPWIEDGDFIACGNCGVVRHCDEWLDIEVEQYKQQKKGSA